MLIHTNRFGIANAYLEHDLTTYFCTYNGSHRVCPRTQAQTKREGNDKIVKHAAINPIGPKVAEEPGQVFPHGKETRKS